MDDAKKCQTVNNGIRRRPKAPLIRSGSFEMIKHYVCSRSCHLLPHLLNSILLSRKSINQTAKQFAGQCKKSLLRLMVYFALIGTFLQLIFCVISLTVFGAFLQPGLVFLLSTMVVVGVVAGVTIPHDRHNGANVLKKTSRLSRSPTKKLPRERILIVNMFYFLAKFKLN